MNIINEIGDTPKGQEMLGRTAERAYQRAQRTSGADKKRYMRTYNDAYRTGGKSANKHLGGSREHFDNGRDYEYEKWADEHNGNVAESKTMNKKLIRLTESDLHKIVKESVNKIINEIGDTPKGQRGLGALHARKVLRNNDLSDDTYNYAQNARGGDKYDNRGNNENPLYHDYANGYIDYLNSHPDEYMVNKRKRMSESDLHRIVKESVNKILKEASIDNVFDGMPHTYTVDLCTKSEGNFGYAFSNIRNYEELDAAIRERFPDVLNWRNPRRNEPFKGWH